jgi:hypothetical protein
MNMKLTHGLCPACAAEQKKATEACNATAGKV